MIDPTHRQAWADTLASTQQQFTHALEAEGFNRVDDTDRWSGQLDVVDLNGRPVATEFEIEIGDSFPFDAPKVTDVSGTSVRTWHHNRDWSLCLYSRRGVADRPWARVPELLARIQKWYADAAGGWVDDPPDLDLDRYFALVDGFATYDDLDSLVGKPVRAKRHGNHLHIDHTGTRPRGKVKSNRRFGWAGDLGELNEPVFDWPTVAERLGDDAPKVKKGILEGRYTFLALRYHRQGHQGCVVLIPTVQGTLIDLYAVPSAATDIQTRRLRAGDPDVVLRLARKKVAIVGLGAVGSHLADLLARGGVGELRLVDFDLVRPGNLIRHLCGDESIGINKAIAVEAALTQAGFIASDSISTNTQPLTAQLAADLTEWADLIVDATADDNVRGLLVELHKQASQHGFDTRVVSVAVHRSGGIVRTDRWPRTTATSPSPIPAHPDGETELREGGCGDPVSTTPPMAVVEAAGLGARHVVDALTGSTTMPDSVVQILRRQPDRPYEELDVIVQ